MSSNGDVTLEAVRLTTLIRPRPRRRPRLRRSVRIAPGTIVVATLVAAAAVLVGVLVPSIDPTLLIAAIIASGFISAVAIRPQIAAYTLLVATPLLAGMNRGAVIPMLRPSEAVAFVAGIGLGVHGLLSTRKTGLVMPRLRTADVTILLLAVTSSVVPILWMLLRNVHVSSDDILYALALWKLYAIYVIFRCSIRTAGQVRVCLYIGMVTSGVVAMIAILQALQLFGVATFLQKYYAPFGVASEVTNARGGATLALPVAVADLLIFNLAIAFGLLIRGVPRKEARFLAAISVLFVMGVLATGELSSVIALAAGGIALAWVTRRGRSLLRMVPVLLLGLLVLEPVLTRRLKEIDPQTGLPISWVGRIDNLRTFFLPRLMSGYSWVLGVRPSARVATTKFGFGWVWIESGYIWLLWGGGIPLFLAYLYFTRENVRVNLQRARFRGDSVGVAALAVVVGLVAVAVCMVFDPHITYRGSGDFMFALLALAAVRVPEAPNPFASRGLAQPASHTRVAAHRRSGSG